LTEEEVLNYLDVLVLKKLWMDGEHKGVGRRELLLIEARNKNDHNYINHRILAMDGAPFSIKEVEAMEKIPRTISTRKLLWMNEGQMMKCSDGKLILEYAQDIERYNAGEKFPRQLLKKSQAGGRQLTSEGASGIRNILYTHPKIGLSSFPHLCALFGDLLLGRPLREEEFVSTATIRSHLARLDGIDRYELG
jgi:hypothetical protein